MPPDIRLPNQERPIYFELLIKLEFPFMFYLVPDLIVE